jgi:hypothetical protein
MTMAITLDFTGFYYQKKIELSELDPNPTVKTVTKFAVEKQGDTGGKLILAEFSPAGFLSSAYVEHRSNPATRQKDTAGNPAPAAALPVGIYGFDDTFASVNRVQGVQIGFSLSWQYYIFREGKLISGPSATSTDRVIVPASQSDTATPLEGNEIIRWRLVAIGGLRELIEAQLAELTPSQKSTLMSRVFTEKLTVRETLKAAIAARELPE